MKFNLNQSVGSISEQFDDKTIDNSTIDSCQKNNNSFDVEELKNDIQDSDNLNRKNLQKLAKKYGIKANIRSIDIVYELKTLVKECIKHQEDKIVIQTSPNKLVLLDDSDGPEKKHVEEDSADRKSKENLAILPSQDDDINSKIKEEETILSVTKSNGKINLKETCANDENAQNQDMEDKKNVVSYSQLFLKPNDNNESKTKSMPPRESIKESKLLKTAQDRRRQDYLAQSKQKSSQQRNLRRGNMN